MKKYLDERKKILKTQIFFIFEEKVKTIDVKMPILHNIGLLIEF